MQAVNQDRQVHWVPIEKVIPYDGNARTHSDEQIEQIVASIQQFGWSNPILVRPTYVIIAGEGRLKAALRLGWAQVPVIEIAGLTETQYRALAIADNQLALNAGWNEDLLNQELAALANVDFDLAVLGLEADELAQRLAATEFTATSEDPDEVTACPSRAVSASGDIWLLGGHRVMCGDATATDQVAALLQSDRADLAFLDPAYNVDYEGYTDQHLKIASDHMSKEEYESHLLNAFQCCRGVLKPTASAYVCHASSWQRVVQGALEQAGFDVRCQIIWAKNTFAWGHARYKFRHEPIFYAHQRGEKDAWYGDKSQSTLWEFDKPTANREHPTMKPVELIERALLNSSRANDIVLDLFGGSGSTLIGCERQRRRARLMEIDPVYVDVIVCRWEKYTGKKAILDNDSRSFEQLQLDRLKAAA